MGSTERKWDGKEADGTEGVEEVDQDHTTSEYNSKIRSQLATIISRYPRIWLRNF